MVVVVFILFQYPLNWLALSTTEDQTSAESETVSHEEYLKQLHKRIVNWLEYRELLSATQQQQL